MTILTQTIERAMLDRAPQLHAQLKAAGKLTGYLRETAAEINSQVATAAAPIGLDHLPRLQKVGTMYARAAAAKETALAEALEFPPDETSSPSQG